MPRLFVMATALALVCSSACSSAALAQTDSASPACKHTGALAAQSGGSGTTAMSATTSDPGNNGSGASSASIGTGDTDKTGMMSPCVPGTGGQATGALPDTSKAQSSSP